MGLSVDQEMVVDMVKQGKNLFVTAKAGSGKTYLLNHIKGMRSQVVVVAPTGVAATLIGGRTIHSQFMIGHKIDMEASLEKLGWKRRRAIQFAELLIIDEISMVSDKLLECVDGMCRSIRGVDMPFGGVQILFFGDFLQLPPVSKGENVTISLGCKSWREANIEPFMLWHNHRQSQDQEFFNVLVRLRYNLMTPEATSLLKSREAEPDDTVIRLYATNAEVDSYNQRMYEKLPSQPEHTYYMEADGEEGMVRNWKENSIVPETLSLRLGCRVMLLANLDVAGAGLYNGSLGTVVGFSTEHRPKPIVSFDNGEQRTISEWSWVVTEKEKDPITKESVEKQVLAIEQIPLRVAYAITTHKSQGCTFDKVYVDCGRFFTRGQGYVAISRAQTLEGLYLKNFDPNRCLSTQNIVNWYLKLEAKTKELRKSLGC